MKTARITAWGMCGKHGPVARASLDNPLVIDIDDTEVASHSDKEHAMSTWKKHFGFYPLAAIVDHGPGLTGNPPPCSCAPVTVVGLGTENPTRPNVIDRRCRRSARQTLKHPLRWCRRTPRAAGTRFSTAEIHGLTLRPTVPCLLSSRSP